MNIHEYQAKQLLKEYGVPVSDGRVVLKADEAKTAAGELDGPIWVVKAQIHAGGRGKGRFKEAIAGEKGGVRVTKSVSEAAEEAQRMLGRTLVTHQTGPAGKVVNRVYIEDGSDIARELYLALLIDRDVEPHRLRLLDRGRHGHRGGGGEDAGEGADLHRRPGLGHLRLPRPPRRLRARARGPAGQAVRRPDQPALPALHREGRRDGRDQPADRDARRRPQVPRRQDGLRFERALPPEGHPRLRDETEEDPKELAASKFDLNYIALDGEIGCMVNGAGLAMATMDIIKLYGAEPANFLDVGGGASKEKVTEAFKIITSDPKVKGILVNIFGGIMRCDIIAEGVIAAVKEVGLQVPLVVRLEGTNVELGKKILNESGLAVIAADDLADAAEKIVKAVKGVVPV